MNEHGANKNRQSENDERRVHPRMPWRADVYSRAGGVVSARRVAKITDVVFRRTQRSRPRRLNDNLADEELASKNPDARGDPSRRENEITVVHSQTQPREEKKGLEACPVP